MIELYDIRKTYRQGNRTVSAANGISMEIHEGKITGLIGPSGCGKITLSRIAMKLIPPDSGRIMFDGEDVTDMGRRTFLPYRKKIQMVFQNPYASLDPMHTMRWSLDEVYRRPIHQSPDYTDLCRKFEVPMDVLDRRPIMVSGGEMQRISIMRSIAFDSKYMILDEPTSMLDVSTQASIMRIFLDMIESDSQKGALLITHDLSLARACCSSLYIMNEGRIVESGRTDDVIRHPSTEFGARYISAYSLDDL